MTIDQSDLEHIVVITDDSRADRIAYGKALNDYSNTKLTLYDAANETELYCLLSRLVDDGTFPSLIILDFVLGSSNGIRVAKHLRGHHPPIPLVVFGSCVGSNIFIAELYRAGVNAYIAKPQTEQEFISSMQSIADVWLHNPQPEWSNRKFPQRQDEDTRIYDRRDDFAQRRSEDRRSRARRSTL